MFNRIKEWCKTFWSTSPWQFARRQRRFPTSAHTALFEAPKEKQGFQAERERVTARYHKELRHAGVNLESRTWPHCDDLALHRVGVCAICDEFGNDLQIARLLAPMNYTGEYDPYKLPDPATQSRPFKTIEKWGGNRAQKALDPLDPAKFDAILPECANCGKPMPAGNSDSPFCLGCLETALDRDMPKRDAPAASPKTTISLPDDVTRRLKANAKGAKRTSPTVKKTSRAKKP